jgi:hypothetical protein
MACWPARCSRRHSHDETFTKTPVRCSALSAWRVTVRPWAHVSLRSDRIVYLRPWRVYAGPRPACGLRSARIGLGRRDRTGRGQGLGRPAVGDTRRRRRRRFGWVDRHRRDLTVVAGLGVVVRLVECVHARHVGGIARAGVLHLRDDRLVTVKAMPGVRAPYSHCPPSFPPWTVPRHVTGPSKFDRPTQSRRRSPGPRCRTARGSTPRCHVCGAVRPPFP